MSMKFTVLLALSAGACLLITGLGGCANGADQSTVGQKTNAGLQRLAGELDDRGRMALSVPSEATAAKPYKAQGNEPGWSLSIGGEV